MACLLRGTRVTEANSEGLDCYPALLHPLLLVKNMTTCTGRALIFESPASWLLSMGSRGRPVARAARKTGISSRQCNDLVRRSE